jgi:hypothetical protein
MNTSTHGDRDDARALGQVRYVISRTRKSTTPATASTTQPRTRARPQSG